MSHPHPSFSIQVDLTNPGQVLACCGLLELAHRQWPGAEGWFGPAHFMIAASAQSGAPTLDQLVRTLAVCEISGLSEQEHAERAALETQARALKKQGTKLSAAHELRRKALGEQARAGPIRLGEPFTLTLNWWQTGDEVTPKTWAGPQELHKIACAAQDALAGASDLTTLLDYGCVLPVESFYFDARRSAHPLDIGFSLDRQDAVSTAHPAVELLCLIGLQRFRPVTTPVKWTFSYWVWTSPLSALVAAPVFSGVSPTPSRTKYGFRLRFRDGQKRYKSFGFALPDGGDA